MNKNLTEIAYILDRSGSMESMVEPAITGFNEFLAEQRKAPGQARLTLVLFDDEYLVPHQSVPIEEVPDLTTKTYEPRNSTALLDAIGQTINDLGTRLAKTPEDERPGLVIIAIFTDGYENNSIKYDNRKISEMIRHQREKYNWQFMFLAANQDAIATAAKMGIDHADAASVDYSGAGIRSSSRAFSSRSAAYRQRLIEEGEVPDWNAVETDGTIAELIQEQMKKIEEEEREGKQGKKKE